MKKVTKIDKIQNITNKRQKLRVAAYCRVSTSNDAQLESLETQKAHYESYVFAIGAGVHSSSEGITTFVADNFSRECIAL